jgi:hypothetical protein
MTFVSPFWLALLLPWAVVAVWLLRARRGERRDVPFLDLWRTPGAHSSAAREVFRAPPVAVVAAMAGALLAIVAAGRPALNVASRMAGLPTAGPHVTIVLDRGLTMSVGDRRREVVESAKPEILKAFGPGPTTFVPVPAPPDGVAVETDRTGWSAASLPLPPTQERSREAVEFAVRQALARNDGEGRQGGAVIVLSDQPIAAADDARVVQIAPAGRIENVAVTRFAVRETPAGGAGGAQAMVTVANGSRQTRATLRVRSRGGGDERNVIERQIELPRRGGEANFFIDLPSPDATAVAEVQVAAGDDLSIDNVAHARRERAYPAIEVRAGVPAEVARVADAYAKTRPPVDTSPHVAVATDDRVPADLPAALIATSAASHGTGGAGVTQVVAHPICAGVDWTSAGARAVGEPPGDGWRGVLTINDKKAVAIRETPHRQVWIGLDAPEFSRTADFVVFWTNVLDWLAGRDGSGGGGAGGQVWTSTVVPPVDLPAPPATDWRAKLRDLRARETHAMDLAPAVALGCVICLILAAAVWPAGRTGGRLTAFSTPRTV